MEVPHAAPRLLAGHGLEAAGSPGRCQLLTGQGNPAGGGHGGALGPGVAQGGGIVVGTGNGGPGHPAGDFSDGEGKGGRSGIHVGRNAAAHQGGVSIARHILDGGGDTGDLEGFGGIGGHCAGEVEHVGIAAAGVGGFTPAGGDRAAAQIFAVLTVHDLIEDEGHGKAVPHPVGAVAHTGHGQQGGLFVVNELIVVDHIFGIPGVTY